MPTITIDLKDERLKLLQERADDFGLSTEEIVLLSIEEFLAQPDEELKRTIDYVLAKNAELYRRLA